MRRVLPRRLAIAGAAVLLCVACGLLFHMRQQARIASHAAQAEEPKSVQNKEPDQADQPAVAPLAQPESGWGHLRGRLVLEGAHAAAKVDVNKDVAFCGKFGLVDESLIVGQKHGLANVVVMLWSKSGESPPAAHASFEKTADAHIVLDNKDCRFVPHVVLLRTTQTLAVKNSDPGSPLPISHNANIASEHNPINPNLAPGESIERRFPKSERLPARISCASHPWMSGWLVIQETPYVAVTSDRGEFVIPHLPAGKWTFHFWHERLGHVDKVSLAGARQDWPRGRKEITIASGQTTDLGQIQLRYMDYQ